MTTLIKVDEPAEGPVEIFFEIYGEIWYSLRRENVYIGAYQASEEVFLCLML